MVFLELMVYNNKKFYREEYNMIENRELRALARSQLKGNWLMAIGITVVYSILISMSGVTVVGPFIVGGPLMLGLYGYFVRRTREEKAEFECLFEGFKTFVPAMVLFLLYTLFITLWTMLFIIPGIIKSFSYSMAFYILRDNPGMGGKDAITASRKMMDGYKGKLFLLYLSFIGWGILCCLTLGIGFLWLIPYVMQTQANFYEELRKSQNGAAA